MKKELLKFGIEPNLFYVHQQPMVPDHGTIYKENPSSHHGGMCEDGHGDVFQGPPCEGDKKKSTSN